MARRAYSQATVNNVIYLYLKFSSISKVEKLTGVTRVTVREMISGKYSERPRVKRLHAFAEVETEPGELQYRNVRKYLCSCGIWTTLKPCCACVAEAWRELHGSPKDTEKFASYPDYAREAELEHEATLTATRRSLSPMMEESFF